MKIILSVAALLMASSGAVHASRDQPQTRAWLEAQRSGAVESQVSVQAANEIEREKAVDRFIKTYEYPIPQNFYGSGFRVGR